MSIADIKSTAEQKMQQSVDSFKSSLTKIRTGRANPGLLDTVQQQPVISAILPASEPPNHEYDKDLISLPTKESFLPTASDHSKTSIYLSGTGPDR